MNADALQIRPTYIVDQVGERTGVVLSIGEYHRLMEALHSSLDAVRKTDASESLAEAARRPTDRPTDIPDLEPVVQEEVFTYLMPRKGADAHAVWRYPTMVVLKGSVVAAEETPTMPEHYRRLRRWLVEQGIIAPINEAHQFTQDYSFNNSSEAVCVVEGGSRSGYDSWRDSQGRTLSDLGYRR